MSVTPVRNLRIPDSLWLAVKAKASSEHTTITAVVIAALRRYLKP